MTAQRSLSVVPEPPEETDSDPAPARALAGILLLGVDPSRVLGATRVEDIPERICRTVFTVGAEMHQAGIPIDIATMNAFVESRALFETKYRLAFSVFLSEILIKAPAASAAEYLAECVREQAVRREIAYAAERLRAAAKSASVLDLRELCDAEMATASAALLRLSGATL